MNHVYFHFRGINNFLIKCVTSKLVDKCVLYQYLRNLEILKICLKLNKILYNTHGTQTVDPLNNNLTTQEIVQY